MNNIFKKIFFLLVFNSVSYANYSCKNIFNSPIEFSNETIAVFNYLNQPLSTNYTKKLQKEWSNIDSELKILRDQPLFLKGKNKWIKNILNARTESSQTLNGITVTPVEKKVALKNFKNANNFLMSQLGQNTDVSINLIGQIHSIHQYGEISSNPISYRSQEITLGWNTFKMINTKDVPQSMENLINWYNNHSNKMHPIELAARFYQKLISIHPFEDANGRTARDIMDYILMKHGYVPTYFYGEELSRSAVIFNQLLPSKHWPPPMTSEHIVALTTEGVKNSIEILESR